MGARLRPQTSVMIGGLYSECLWPVSVWLGARGAYELVYQPSEVSGGSAGS